MAEEMKTYNMSKRMTCVEETLANESIRINGWHHLDTIVGQSNAEGVRMDIYLNPENGSVYVWETMNGLTCFGFFGTFILDKKNTF